MSVKYIPVQWNRSKWVYDAVLVLGVGAFLWIFIYVAPGVLNHERPINAPIRNARAFGACAFVMLTIILCIGPLARLDRRFLVLLYNRRHFGVMTCFVALSHAYFVLGWYFAFFRESRWEAVLFANTSFGQMLGFPFVALGIFALICLMVLAVTSHDFWLKFLTPPIWKAIHFLIYPAYVAVVGHVALGAFQARENQTFAVIFLAGAILVAGLHVLAALKETREDNSPSGAQEWIRVCAVDDIPEARARIAVLPSGDRVAVFRHEGKLSAIANACAHQNGPLGEGRVIDCLVTCPWHGFQYNVTNGRSPAPFTEMVPTYRLEIANGAVMVDPKSNPPGTHVDPVSLSEMPPRETSP